jgi:SSS family solute:Na+ symporter
VVILAAIVIGVTLFGMWIGRKEVNTGDYYLAGKTVAWWAVAGSIFGTNISSHHMVGMMGAGLKEGFAQANFEFGAIFGLLMLCYFFLPFYRRMGLYTLSEYLGRRFDARSQLVYSITNMAFLLIQMVGTMVLGALTIATLTGDSPYAISYELAVCLLATVAAAYTFFGGLKADIFNDVVQSVLLLLASGMLAVLAIWHPNVGGLTGLLEKQPEKFHVFFDASHPELPWSGVLSGLMVLHLYYWGTNQFIVQRTLGARSDWDARMGTIAAGFFKLLIPFLCIVPGMAAGYILAIDPATESDTAFAGLTRELLPTGFGLVGLVMAGLVAGILSTIDSMMNSTSTLFTFDIYKKYVRPDASEMRLIWVGRASMMLMVALAIGLSLYFGREKGGIFNKMVDYNAYLVPGVIVAYVAGILQPFVTGTASFICILAGPLLSIFFEQGARLGFDHRLQAFHRTGLATLACYGLLLVVSFRTQHERDRGKEQYTWSRFKIQQKAERDATRPWWQRDKLWAGALVACTLALCWFFA